MERHHTSNPFGGSANLSTTPKLEPIPTPHPVPLPALIDIGLLKSTLLPSLTINTALGALAYTAGRLTNRLDTKDVVWPLAPVLNAWYAAVVCHTPPFTPREEGGVSLYTAWKVLGAADKLFLGGVTLWGGRLFYRVVTRAWARGGRDDPRYEGVKYQRGLVVGGDKVAVVERGGFWDWAWLTAYLPEAVVQSVIALSVTTSFRLGLGGLGQSRVFGVGGGCGEVVRALAVALFSAGFALEVVADWQLGEFKEKVESKGKMCREGVWGVVRHPNYLGDALVHFSFPLFLLANNMLAPVALLGPLANYLFLRCVGGDKQNEESQARRYSAEDVGKKVDFDRYRHERNSFWPDASQVHNKWAWAIVGCGVAGAVADRAIRALF